MDKIHKLTEKMQERRKALDAWSLREGQIIFSALADVDKPLYDKLTGTASDCFYDNTKIPKFYETLFKEWRVEGADSIN